MKPAMPNEQQEPMWLSVEGKTNTTAERQRKLEKKKSTQTPRKFDTAILAAKKSSENTADLEGAMPRLVMDCPSLQPSKPP